MYLIYKYLNEKRFYCCSTFNSLSRVSNNNQFCITHTLTLVRNGPSLQLGVTVDMNVSNHIKYYMGNKVKQTHKNSFKVVKKVTFSYFYWMTIS